MTGGFGVVLGFAHDWANRENARRSWDLVARYVIPALNGSVRPMQASADYVEANKAELIGGASAAVMSKIMAHEGAAAAMATTMTQMAERAAARKAKNEEPANDPAFRPGAGLPNPCSGSPPTPRKELSVVLQRHRVRGDVHLRLVLGDLDDATLAEELGAQLGTARLARAVEPFVGGGATARARDGGGVGQRTPSSSASRRRTRRCARRGP